MINIHGVGRLENINPVAYTYARDVWRLLEFLAVFSIVTFPFDIFLSFDVMGMNLRVAYIVIMIISFFLIVELVIMRQGRLILPPGFGYISLWLVINIICSFANSDMSPRVLGYNVYFIINILLVISVVKIYAAEQSPYRLLEHYYLLYSINAGFGILQFILSIFGINILVAQDFYSAITVGRINGFSHEPSAYAGILAMGYVTMRSFHESNIFISSRKSSKIHIIMVATALLLSTSKSAIALLLAYETWKISRVMFSSVFSVKLKKNNLKYIFMILLLAVVLVLLSSNSIFSQLLEQLSGGSGLYGTASHSLDDRLMRFLATIELAQNHLWFGISYGAIPAELTAMLDSKERVEPMFMLAEVIAATGLLGFFVWGLYMITLLSLPRKLKNPMHRRIMLGFSTAMIFDLPILISNFARGIIWCHIAVWSAVFIILRRMENKQVYLKK